MNGSPGGRSAPRPEELESLFRRGDASGPPLILDGGLATALEAKGFDLDDPLWSARVLIDAPGAVREVHSDYLAAGADVIATVSYQASFTGLALRGLTHAQSVDLLRRATALALEARDGFWSDPENRKGRRRPLVAASIGPYGAYLADGSEYTGDYGVDQETLYDFHRERWHLLAESGADLLACETIPSAPEASVLLRLMAETQDIPAWVSFCCRDGRHLSDGTPIDNAVRGFDDVPNLAAVGINCTKPRFVQELLSALTDATKKPVLVYPNAGEEYDIHTRRWVTTPEPVDWSAAAAEWIRAGASGVGGCCRVGPAQIAQLRAGLVN